MAIVLGENQYGKAQVRLVRVVRDTARHEMRDLTVSTALRGRFTAAHVDGDQADVLPTDTQKNTVYAFARERGVGSVEGFALELARHFVADVEPVASARVEAAEHAWARAVVDGAEHDHAFVRTGGATRTATVTVEADGEWVVSGLRDLVLLKSTGSEFRGFRTDRYTTLEPTADRVMATSLVARWRWAVPPADWDAAWTTAREALVSGFAALHSKALQQTLWEMGRRALEALPGMAEIRLSAPNRHHVLVDLEPFGLDNPGEVFVATDRPYGLIEAAVARDDAPLAGPAWRAVPGFV